MSKTPWTDEHIMSTTDGIIEKSFCRELEYKLHIANDHIKRLKKAGDVMYKLLDPPSICMRTTEYDNALQGWDDAKLI